MLNKDFHKNSIIKNPLPEKVLQFGTGVLLRGLCDFIIDKANKKGIFNGSILIVKTTGPNVSEFAAQDNLYTVCVRGFESGSLIEENVIVESVSRVLSSRTHWAEILKTAEQEEMEIVVSNTTESGLSYLKENIFENVPDSFPGKLTAWLYRRFETIKKPVVVIPTELLVNNGKILHDLVFKHIEDNNLGRPFVEWLNEHVRFCSSLVDRIIPGKPKGQELESLYSQLGYNDQLILKSESYKLWAIEGENLEKTLSFFTADKGVKLEKNIEKYRELKLRLLNAPHTLACGLAFLSGFELVKEAMEDDHFEKYITILMLTELAPAIAYNMDNKTVQRYAREVLDRFRNPYLEHQWLSITLQYSLKMKARAIPLLLNYYEEFGVVPQYFARCFAAYLLFMKGTKNIEGKFYGSYEGKEYLIQCDSAEYFYNVWEKNKANEVVNTVLKNVDLWGSDLSKLKDFEEQVSNHLSNMLLMGVKDAVGSLNVYA